MTSHCWLWLFRAHSLPLETNMKQNAVMLAPRAEGIKHPADMVQSHQNALLSCVLQGEPGEPCAGEMLTLSLCCHHWPYGNNKHETSPIYFFLVEGLIRLNYKSRCLHVWTKDGSNIVYSISLWFCVCVWYSRFKSRASWLVDQCHSYARSDQPKPA